MRVLVTGATGFVGRRFCRELTAAGHSLVALSRDADRAAARLPAGAQVYPWQPLLQAAPVPAFEGVDAVVHLAGESVAGRWTAAKRRAIHDSRVIGTRHLVQGMAAASRRPERLVSASAIGYYGDRGEEELTEESPPGEGFLADTCRAWEAEAEAAAQLGVAVTRVRIGIVLGAGGGALAAMLLPARLGLGGPLGSGRQWWSWIHLDDLVAVLILALGTLRAPVVNATAPQPVRQRDFARALGRVLGRPAFLPAPAFALRLLAGGFAAELLGSKRVLPAALERAGFTFRQPQLQAALRSCLRHD